MNNLVKDYERVDDLQLNGLKIIQDPSKYCFSSDAVLLANFVRAKKTENVLDMCSGSGVVGILVYEKTKPNNVTLLELQQNFAEMSKRSIELNGLQDKIKVVNSSVQNSLNIFKPESFSVICCNPPYKSLKGHKLSGKNEIDVCKYEVELSLEELVKTASKLLNYGGKFFFVYDSSRLVEIITTLKKYGLEPKKLEFVYPKSTIRSFVVLVEAKKNAKSGVIVSPPKILN